MASAPSVAIDAYGVLYDKVLETILSSTEADGHLSQIDAELEAIDHSVAHLRKRRNALTPIGRLPTDIYALIFDYVALFDPLIDEAPLVGSRSFGTSRQGRLALGWVTITHVCSLWRAMALQDSRLWFQVPLRLGVDWAIEIIRRCGERGRLFFEYLRYDHERHLDPDFIATLLRQNLPYIEQLRVDVDSASEKTGRILSTLSRALDNPAPQLRSLHWYSDLLDGRHWPPSLFAGQAPRLTTIYLRGHPTIRPDFGPAQIFSSLETVIPQLTRLIMDLKAMRRLDIEEFLTFYNALSAAHKLEHLDIRGLLFRSLDPDIAKSLAPLDFPSMKTFRVITPLTISAQLMQLAHLPDTCTVEIGCYVHNANTSDLRELSQSLYDRFATITTLELAARRLPDPHIAFSGWSARSSEPLLDDFIRHDDSSLIDASLGRPSPDISITFRECPKCERNTLRDRPPFLTKLLSLLAIPLAGIENLSLRTSDSSGLVTYSGPDWTFVRESFKSLRWLRVDRHLASQLLRQQWNLNENILAPSVAHILLIGVEWSPNPPDAQVYEQRKMRLRRLLQVGNDASESHPLLRSVTIGGRAGGSHEALVNDMPDIPFTSLQAPAGRDGSPGGEDNLLEMY